MTTADVIVVGGGPAGSSCARRLTEAGFSVIILDKAEFPRDKLCAGWITPRIFRLLGLAPEEYPHGLTRFSRLHFRFKALPFAPPTRQFAIRRIEFDHWLLQRSGAEVRRHRVWQIEERSEEFIVDGEYSARFLIGAGGTQCPVARSLFQPAPDASARRIVTLERELVHSPGTEECYLWFFRNRLPGYGWFFPKTGGFTVVGVGGLLSGLLRRGSTIREHWNLLTERLAADGLIPRTALRPAGHSYFLRSPEAKRHLRGARTNLQRGNALLVGDAAGLATRDMGEGIGPAIHSGILAAEAIINGRPYSVLPVRTHSIPEILFPPRSPRPAGR